MGVKFVWFNDGELVVEQGSEGTVIHKMALFKQTPLLVIGTSMAVRCWLRECNTLLNTKEGHMSTSEMKSVVWSQWCSSWIQCYSQSVRECPRVPFLSKAISLFLRFLLYNMPLLISFTFSSLFFSFTFIFCLLKHQDRSTPKTIDLKMEKKSWRFKEALSQKR
jgi:hypothetical protein